MVDNLIRLFQPDTPANDYAYTTNGLGTLTEATSCKVVEERNGEYELVLDYPITGKRYNSIKLRAVIVAKPNPFSYPQPFRIYSISKPINGIVTINAAHISYDLSGFSCSPFTAASVGLAFVTMKQKCPVDCPFTFWTDKTTTGTMKVDTPSSIRSLLGGSENSILDIYGGGEYEFDRYNVRLHQNRGTDRGVTIRYGKNLTDIEQEENCSEVYTGVHPYWYSGSSEDGELVELDEKVVYASGTYNYVKIMPLDLTDKFDEKPTQAQLKQAAQKYMDDNKIGVPKVSITVSFLQLAQSDEYSEYRLLEEVHLCDTVRVIFPELGVDATAKCVKTTYDVITGKYDEIELGEARTNIADTISSQQRAIIDVPDSTKTWVDQAVDRATKAITGGLGGYVVMRASDGGEYPDELLIMDTPDISTATKVWRWNKKGLGYSGTGYNGPYTSAMTADGEIVANLITAGEFDGSLIRAGSIDAETIRVGFNGNTKYIQLEGQKFNIYDSNDRLLMSLGYSGQVFYYNGTNIGRIGTNMIGGHPSYRGIVFDLEYAGGYMAWAAADTPSTPGYALKMCYHHTNEVTSKGFHFADAIYPDSNLYLNSGCRYYAQNESSAVRCSGKMRYGSNDSSIKIELDAGGSFTIYENCTVNFNSDIDMNGHNVNNTSDARLKMNIEDVSMDALSIISSIDLKSFDWIRSGDHERIGVVAQQLREVAPELVSEDKDTGVLSIKESRLVYYCIKAIQELAGKSDGKKRGGKWEDTYSKEEKDEFIASLPTTNPKTDDKFFETLTVGPSGVIPHASYPDTSEEQDIESVDDDSDNL